MKQLEPEYHDKAKEFGKNWEDAFKVELEKFKNEIYN